jgi:hypothetical protein
MRADPAHHPLRRREHVLVRDFLSSSRARHLTITK